MGARTERHYTTHDGPAFSVPTQPYSKVHWCWHLTSSLGKKDGEGKPSSAFLCPFLFSLSLSFVLFSLHLKFRLVLPNSSSDEERTASGLGESCKRYYRGCRHTCKHWFSSAFSHLKHWLNAESFNSFDKTQQWIKQFFHRPPIISKWYKFCSLADWRPYLLSPLCYICEVTRLVNG